jgi:hypothetical protein
MLLSETGKEKLDLLVVVAGVHHIDLVWLG